MSRGDDIPEPGANPFQGLGGPLPSFAKPPGRSPWRVLSAAAFVILAGLIILAGFLLAVTTGQRWLGHVALAAAAAACGVGFAIYDYRGPFGPRPSSRLGK